MQVVIEVGKSIEENAGIYFDKSKKAKLKLEGAKEALEESKKKLKKLEKEAAKQEAETAQKVELVDKWYHKFRWFRTSDGFLAIGGRDATTNDIIVKKHADKGDLVFHTETPGSPFFILKARGGEDGKDLVGEFSDQAKQEVAIADATFSKAWQRGLGATEVYCVNPDQLKKELGLPKGTFMVYGKRQYFTADLQLCVGFTGTEIMAGPVDSVTKHCKQYMIVTHGSKKVSAIAKEFVKSFGGNLDAVIRVFPGGEFKILKTVGGIDKKSKKANRGKSKQKGKSLKSKGSKKSKGKKR